MINQFYRAHSQLFSRKIKQRRRKFVLFVLCVVISLSAAVYATWYSALDHPNDPLLSTKSSEWYASHQQCLTTNPSNTYAAFAILQDDSFANETALVNQLKHNIAMNQISNHCFLFIVLPHFQIDTCVSRSVCITSSEHISTSNTIGDIQNAVYLVSMSLNPLLKGIIDLTPHFHLHLPFHLQENTGFSDNSNSHSNYDNDILSNLDYKYNYSTFGEFYTPQIDYMNNNTYNYLNDLFDISSSSSTSSSTSSSKQKHPKNTNKYKYKLECLPLIQQFVPIHQPIALPRYYFSETNTNTNPTLFNHEGFALLYLPSSMDVNRAYTIRSYIISTILTYLKIEIEIAVEIATGKQAVHDTTSSSRPSAIVVEPCMIFTPLSSISSNTNANMNTSMTFSSSPSSFDFEFVRFMSERQRGGMNDLQTRHLLRSENSFSNNNIDGNVNNNVNNHNHKDEMKKMKNILDLLELLYEDLLDAHYISSQDHMSGLKWLSQIYSLAYPPTSTSTVASTIASASIPVTTTMITTATTTNTPSSSQTKSSSPSSPTTPLSNIPHLKLPYLDPRNDNIAVCVNFNFDMKFNAFHLITKYYSALYRDLILIHPSQTLTAQQYMVLSSYKGVKELTCTLTKGGFHQQNCLHECLVEFEKSSYDRNQGVLYVADDIFFNFTILQENWNYDTMAFPIFGTIGYMLDNKPFPNSWPWLSKGPLWNQTKTLYRGWPDEWKNLLSDAFGRGNMPTNTLSDMVYVPKAHNQWKNFIQVFETATALGGESFSRNFCEVIVPPLVAITMLVSNQKIHAPTRVEYMTYAKSVGNRELPVDEYLKVWLPSSRVEHPTPILFDHNSYLWAEKRLNYSLVRQLIHDPNHLFIHGIKTSKPASTESALFKEGITQIVRSLSIKP